MQLDAVTAPDGTTLSADVCIVGAGPAGLALADALQAAGLQVIVIESGGPAGNEAAQQLNEGEVSGDPYDLRASRARGIGGTARVWNTRIDGATFAKYVPLDAIDLLQRDWIPWSGWPIGRDVLEPYYQWAQAVCGLGPGDYSPGGWNDRQEPLLEFPAGGLTNAIYQLGPAARFTESLPASLNLSPSVMMVHGATVTELSRSPGGDRIAEARWATLAGTRGVARAASFVLAAGAIENARILLRFRQGISRSSDDWLGRGFMEHPIDRSLQLSGTVPGLSATSGFYSFHRQEGLGLVAGRMALGAEMMRAERLPNASLRLTQDEPNAVLNVGGVTPAPLRRIIPVGLRRRIGTTIRNVAAIPGRLRRPRPQVLIDLEQIPHPENRIVLGNVLDALGQPRVALHWQWREQDQANRRRILTTVVREFARARAGRPMLAAGSPLNPNAHHHAGTTRMHIDPELGVVDENLRVHGEENLFVTGASVFPTAGSANPTLTIIALTLRLADTLSQRQRSPATA